MTKIMTWRRVAALLSALILIGCAQLPTDGNNAQSLYDASIPDAAVTSPGKVVALLPIPAGDTVIGVSWVTERRLPCQAGAVQCDFPVGGDRLWVTLKGEVGALCRSWNLSGDALRRRLEQLLGLPPDPPPQFQKAWFVEMQIPRDRVERPCLGVDDSDPARPRCTINTDAKHAASADTRNFVGQQMAAAYVVGAGGPGYPYTRLGYTYDWNPDAAAHQHYGASEFVVAPGTVAKVTAQIRTDDYCKPGSK
jgi:hypothetical protein